MARGFNTTLGSAATDYVVGASIASTPSSASWSLWSYRRANATQFMVWEASGATRVSIWSNGSVYVYQRRFSTTTGVWTFAMPSLSVWAHIGVTHDGSSTANTPVIYVNGSAVSVTLSTTPVGTVDTAAATPYIGGTAGANTWDGLIAKVCRWDGAILSAAEMAVLAKGVLPYRIRRASIGYYCDVEGVSGETFLKASGGAAGTVNGTARANNPPVAMTTPHVPAMPLYITQAKFSRPMQHLRAGSRQGMQ